ncbi:hypothetical protein H0G86_005477 [Trichoderma simmonsii]|uniref:Uncharacterized protein n=1 Tax=Trichoderma simmonsii TaxID=1491479 RepID=A0A8G0LES6_9HYPO|nr:hypothetical protein H0G86_005477 [Trichoderma simmonsii]
MLGKKESPGAPWLTIPTVPKLSLVEALLCLSNTYSYYRRHGELLDASHKQGVLCLGTHRPAAATVRAVDGNTSQRTWYEYIRETLSTGAPSSERTSASDGSVNGSIPEPETEDKASRLPVFSHHLTLYRETHTKRAPS